jgi:hypothetical protein
MDTTWRNTTVKSSLTLGRASMLVAAIALDSAMMAVPCLAQMPLGGAGQFFDDTSRSKLRFGLLYWQGSDGESRSRPRGASQGLFPIAH